MKRAPSSIRRAKRAGIDWHLVTTIGAAAIRDAAERENWRPSVRAASLADLYQEIAAVYRVPLGDVAAAADAGMAS